MSYEIAVSYLGAYYLSAEQLRSDAGCIPSLTNTDAVKLIQLQEMWELLCKPEKRRKTEEIRETSKYFLCTGVKIFRDSSVTKSRFFSGVSVVKNLYPLK